MGWPYEFVSLTSEQKALRRDVIAFYGLVAHVSAFMPALLFLAVRLGRRLAGAASSSSSSSGDSAALGAYREVPNSPVVKAQRLSAPGGAAARWRVFVWWMGDELRLSGVGWGRRDQWVFGTAWMGWLLLLCALGTGKDYFHLTKRFGIVAASQLPVQYLMSLKILNPFAWAFGSSHEEVNRFHRVLGRIIYALLLLHIVFYNVYFVWAGTFPARLFELDILCGVIASLGMHAISGTALRAVRQYSYRIFFVTHLAAALFIPVLVFFHVASPRVYVAECLIAFLADIFTRRVTTIDAPSTLEIVPGTNLLKVSSTIPLDKIDAFKARPGSHIYLSIPPGSRPPTGAAIFDFLFNPFTVAAVDAATGSITLIARTRGGPLTNHLASLAANPSASETLIRLGVEGPKGAVGKRFPAMTGPGVDRILLVAGGVGGTFALPVYQAIVQENPSARVQLVWAIRSAGDATWGVSSTASGKSLLDDEHVDIFITGDMGVADDSDDAAGGAVEMSNLRTGSESAPGRRPDVDKIVGDVFRQGLEETVAVLVCGPHEMARDVRQAVRPWVMKGRKVLWHNENFGW